MSDDIISQLEAIETDSEDAHCAHVCGKAAETILRLRAENEKLRAALIKAGNGLLDADAKIKNMLAVLGSLIGASARLSIAAQTTGGVAGRDEGLCEAIDNLVQPLANARAAATALKETGDE